MEKMPPHSLYGVTNALRTEASNGARNALPTEVISVHEIKYIILTLMFRQYDAWSSFRLVSPAEYVFSPNISEIHVPYLITTLYSMGG